MCAPFHWRFCELLRAFYRVINVAYMAIALFIYVIVFVCDLLYRVKPRAFVIAESFRIAEGGEYNSFAVGKGNLEFKLRYYCIFRALLFVFP